jgi:hypothetical protein
VPLFTVVTSKASYHVGEPVVLTVALANASSEPLWINGRLQLAQPTSKGGEIWFDVQDEKGRLPAQGIADAALAPASTYRILKPDDVVAKHVVLDQFFEMDHPGSFTIVAHYKDPNPHRPPPPPGARPATEATAPPVKITIYK